jgi:hypothetical protein
MKFLHLILKKMFLLLKSKSYNLAPILEEIARRQIQEYMDAGFYVRDESEYVSPAFVVSKPQKAYDPQFDDLKRYFERNFILPRHETMDELIHELEEPFSLRLVVDFVS